jgi:hypothetical protein
MELFTPDVDRHKNSFLEYSDRKATFQENQFHGVPVQPVTKDIRTTGEVTECQSFSSKISVRSLSQGEIDKNIGPTKAYLRRRRLSQTQKFLSKSDEGKDNVSDNGHVEVATEASFPYRARPIEFLKTNVMVELQTDYNNDIFIKLNQSSHLNSQLTNVDEESVFCSESRLVEIDTMTESESAEIEVVNVETVPSSKESLESNEELCPKIRANHFDGSYKDHEATANVGEAGQKALKKESTLLNATPNNIEKSTSTEEATVKEILSDNEEPCLSASTSTESREDNLTENDNLKALKKFVQLAAPILRSRIIPLSKDDPIRQAAKKLGINIDDSKYSTDEPDEQQIQVPLNVEILSDSNFSRALKKIPSQDSSIHLTTESSSLRKNRFMSPSSGSLLDSVTDISDLPSASHSQQFQTIDLKTIHSGSVSELTFHKKSSEDSEDALDDPNAISGCKGITQWPNRHQRKDLVIELESPKLAVCIGNKTKPSAYRVDKSKTNGKPLGASADEIEMINTFLAIAGPDFDGARLSIESREQLHSNARKAGLPEDFINRILDQSAGILSWDQGSFYSSETSEVSERPQRKTSKSRVPVYKGSASRRPHQKHKSSRTKDREDDLTKTTASTSFSDEYSYGEERFKGKTPKEDAFSCLKNIFWIESSNIVGDDMTENILAVMSADSETVYSRNQRRYV